MENDSLLRDSRDQNQYVSNTSISTLLFVADLFSWFSVFEGRKRINAGLMRRDKERERERDKWYDARRNSSKRLSNLNYPSDVIINLNGYIKERVYQRHRRGIFSQLDAFLSRTGIITLLTGDQI